MCTVSFVAGRGGMEVKEPRSKKSAVVEIPHWAFETIISLWP